MQDRLVLRRTNTKRYRCKITVALTELGAQAEPKFQLDLTGKRVVLISDLYNDPTCTPRQFRGTVVKRLFDALHDEDALAVDTIRAAIQHLRTARQLLKQTAALMQKSNGASLPRKRIVQALKLAESALRTARRSQARPAAGASS